jgi:adenylate kinase family enzyme
VKINVIGTSGSGKSTFAKALACALDTPYVEMDQLHWKPNWTESSDDEFFSTLEQALCGDSWVLDGNYTRTTYIKWRRVDRVIWLDYSFARTLYQACKRALSRAITQRELWPGTGNKENFGRLFSKDSMILWTFQHYSPNKEKFAELMRNTGYAEIEFIRLCSPQEASTFIKTVQQTSSNA